MTADAIATVLSKQGPLALTIVILAVMLFALGGAFLAFVKWSSQNTVPITIYQLVVDGISKEMAEVRLELRGRP